MKTTLTRLMLVGLLGTIVLGSALAGELEPPEPPAPTMVTLQEIYDLIQSQNERGGAVAKTGQTGCWNASGTPIDCTGTGQDGEYQYGTALSPRFTDNGDGTITDNLTGLVWLRDAHCFVCSPSWSSAIGNANSLSDGSCGLSDESAPGDWRLPNVKELQSILDYGQQIPALPPGHPFQNVEWGSYWTSTTREGAFNQVWWVDVGGSVGFYDKVNSGLNSCTWPVRSGQ